jgi:hypothetical protein
MGMRLTTFLILWLLMSATGCCAALLRPDPFLSWRRTGRDVFVDVAIIYMANRWFRTNHPQPVTLDDPHMKFALMTTMLLSSRLPR